MFPGFREDSIDVGEVAIRAVAGGSGPPLLLLHGYPQTHVIWRKVATDVRGRALPCGHYIPEEAPDALLDELLGFLGKDAQ